MSTPMSPLRSPTSRQNDGHEKLGEAVIDVDEDESHGNAASTAPAPAQPLTLKSSLWFLFMSDKINALLIFLPFGLAAGYAHWGPVAAFVLNFLAIIPMSKILGTTTEELSLRTGPAIGSLLNAAMGNSIELIVSIFALQENLIEVVKSSLLGSIIGTLLLVLGACFLCGGLQYKVQTFSDISAQTNSGLLALAVLALLVPAAYDLTMDPKNPEGALVISRGTSILLIIVYCAFIYFQLKTHKHLYDMNVIEPENEMSPPAGTVAATNSTDVSRVDDKLEDAENEVPQMLAWVAGVSLVVVTVFIALSAEILVGAIEPLTKTGGISEAFVAFILLPICGNLAEHMGALSFAMKNKMELAIGIGIGSSLQIALFVTPVTVLLGWAMGRDMSLDFHAFPSFVLFASVLMVNYVIQDGKSHYLEGVMLVAAYIIVALAFWEFK